MKRLSIEEKQGLLYEFGDKLITGEYDAILYNGKTPITAQDPSLLEFIIEMLEDRDKVKVNSNSSITVTTGNEVIKLKGYKHMSDGEIILRNYLCECGDTLIVKDDAKQLLMREDNFHDIDKEGIWNKCKHVVNIRSFIKDTTKKIDEIYNMNWDAILVHFKGQNQPELWQRW